MDVGTRRCADKCPRVLQAVLLAIKWITHRTLQNVERVTDQRTRQSTVIAARLDLEESHVVDAFGSCSAGRPKVLNRGNLADDC